VTQPAFSPDQLLTPEEAHQVDAALLTSKDKFATRVAIYALRSLKQIAVQQAIDPLELEEPEVLAWIKQDEIIRQEGQLNDQFVQFFARLVLASRKPLSQAAAAANVKIGDLTAPQVIAWFEQQAAQP